MEEPGQPGAETGSSNPISTGGSSASAGRSHLKRRRTKSGPFCPMRQHQLPPDTTVCKSATCFPRHRYLSEGNSLHKDKQ